MSNSTRIGGIHVDLGLGTAKFDKGVARARKEAAGLGASLKSSLAGVGKNLFTPMAAAATAAEQAQEARKQAIEGLFQMGGDALAAMVAGSMKAEEALKRLIVQLAAAAAQAALLGSGPLAGLFGGGCLGGPAALTNFSGGAR